MMILLDKKKRPILDNILQGPYNNE